MLAFLSTLAEAAATPTFWWAIGILGTLCWGSRFLIQWIASERAKRSVIPVAFWWISIAGAGFMLSYAVFRGDPIFIVNYATGGFIYLRNLVLLRRERREPTA